MKVKTIYNEIPTLSNGITVTGVDWRVNTKPDFTGRVILNDLNSSEHNKKTIQHNFQLDEMIYAEVITKLSNGLNYTSGVTPITESTISKGNAPIAYPPVVTVDHIGLNPQIQFTTPRFIDNGVVFTQIRLRLCDLGHRPFYEVILSSDVTSYTLTPSDYSRPAFIVEVVYETSIGIKSPTGRRLVVTGVDRVGDDPRLDEYVVDHSGTTLLRLINTDSIIEDKGAFIFNECVLITDSDYSKTITLKSDTVTKQYALGHIGQRWILNSKSTTIARGRVTFEHKGKIFNSSGNATFTADGLNYQATLPNASFANVDMIQVNENTVVLCSVHSFKVYLIEVSGTTITFIEIMEYADTTGITHYAHTVKDNKITIGDVEVDIYTGDTTQVEWWGDLHLDNVKTALGSNKYTTINKSTGDIVHNHDTLPQGGTVRSLHTDGTNILIYPTTEHVYLVNASGSIITYASDHSVNTQAKSTKYQYR